MMIELKIPREHPAYAGHFPGMPILPGAALLDEVLYAMADAEAVDPVRWHIASVKFLGAVEPGNPLTLEHTAANDLTIRFSLRSGARAIASGLLSAAPTQTGAVDGA